MSLFDKVAGAITKRATAAIGNITAAKVGTAVLNRAVGKFAPGALGVVKGLQRGDYFGAAMSGLNALRMKAGISSPFWNPTFADIMFQATSNPLLGGITPEEAARITIEMHATPFSKKNLFFLEVKDWNPPGEDISNRFNMFAISVSYTARSITGQSRPIGMGNMDEVTGTERIEMRITTYDDTSGSIKAWFDSKYLQIAHKDGTAGVPTDYLLNINVIQSAISDESMGSFGGYKSELIMRPVSLDIELDRSEDQMQQISMTFTQFDTFLYAGY